MDIELLIAEVYARPPIWMSKHKHHRNRGVIDKMCEEICAAVDIPKDQARSKWKNLKDHYRKEKKKVMKCRSGDEGGKMQPSNWPYFELLHFLKDETIASTMSGNLTQSQEEDVLPEAVEEESFEELAEQEYVQQPTDSEETQLESAPVSRTTQPSTSTNKQFLSNLHTRKRKETVHETVAKKMLSLEEQKVKILQAEQQGKESDDFHFLMSILPYFKNMDPLQKLRVRNKITQVIIDEAQDHSNQSSRSVQGYSNESSSSGFNTFNYSDYGQGYNVPEDNYTQQLHS